MKPMNAGSGIYLEKKQDWFVGMQEWMGCLVVSDVGNIGIHLKIRLGSPR